MRRPLVALPVPPVPVTPGAVTAVLLLLFALLTTSAGAASAAGSTAFGSCLQVRSGETFSHALARVEAYDGRLGTVRVFQTVPNTSVFTALGTRRAVVSFKLSPAAVLAGQYDAQFRAWFAAAPTGRPTWWTYYHEPDAAHATGAIKDLSQYRAAFARVARLARATGNGQLRTTLVLTGYAGMPASGRHVQDYWPGSALTDVLAWDVYNGWATKQGRYGDPTDQMSHDRAVSLALGKPWAVAEFGSVVVRGDDGSGRGAWIKAFSRYAYDHGALFASYFDSNTYGQGAEYRLLDGPSQRAYHSVVSDQDPT